MGNQSPRDFKILVKGIVTGFEASRSSCSSNPNETNNAFGLLRSDCINSELRKMADNSNGRYEFKHFPVNNWDGTLFLDRVNKEVFSFFLKETLDNIINNHNSKKTPHYLEVFLHFHNNKVEATNKQLYFPGFESSHFSEEKFGNKYNNITNGESLVDYTHWVIAYEASHYEITSVKAILYDDSFNISKEIDLNDYLMPNVIELSRDEISIKEEKDVHSLVTVKANHMRTKGKNNNYSKIISPKKLVKEKNG